MTGLVNTYLLNEHNIITEFCEVLKNEIRNLSADVLPNQDRFKKILGFARIYADKVHHLKEENLLFTHIYPIPNIEGGPRCIYYKELQMQRTPAREQVADIQKTIGHEDPQFYDNWKNNTKEGCIVNPLLEEHILGRNLLALIEFEFNQRIKGISKNNAELNYALYRYIAMLEEHIDKENTCFANTVDKYLPEDLQVRIVDDFKRMDEGPCAHLIHESLNSLTQLKNK